MKKISKILISFVIMAALLLILFLVMKLKLEQLVGLRQALQSQLLKAAQLILKLSAMLLLIMMFSIVLMPIVSWFAFGLYPANDIEMLSLYSIKLLAECALDNA